MFIKNTAISSDVVNKWKINLEVYKETALITILYNIYIYRYT